MLNWFSHLAGDIGFFIRRFHACVRPSGSHRHTGALWLLGLFSSLGILGLVMYWGVNSLYPHTIAIPERIENNTPLTRPLDQPVRDIPKRFPADTHMPKRGEGTTSGSIHLTAFVPKIDLVRIDDPRVWWESDHDTGDTEDDHILHKAMEIPLRRLINLVEKEGGTLKVQDTYRPTGVHSPKSLHKQGRAIDITCDELGLERLAKLTWAAGFDWVYYEASARGGSHVHASVRAE